MSPKYKQLTTILHYISIFFPSAMHRSVVEFPWEYITEIVSFNPISVFTIGISLHRVKKLNLLEQLQRDLTEALARERLLFWYLWAWVGFVQYNIHEGECVWAAFCINTHEATNRKYMAHYQCHRLAAPCIIHQQHRVQMNNPWWAWAEARAEPSGFRTCYIQITWSHLPFDHLLGLAIIEAGTNTKHCNLHS